MTAAQKMMMVAPAGGGAFNPETDIAWHSLFWAEGTDFAAEGYADGDSVTTWPNDGTSAVTMFPEGTAPLFESSNSTLNSQPAVSFASTNSSMANATGNPPFTPTTNLNLDYTNGVSVVVITYFPTTVANGSKPWGRVSDSPRWSMFRAGSNWYWYTGGPNTARAGADANPHLFFGLNGGGVQGRMEVDGTGWDETGVAGDSLQAFELYGGRGSPSDSGSVAFWALYEGDFRQDASYGDFKTWVGSHYGLTIA